MRIRAARQERLHPLGGLATEETECRTSRDSFVVIDCVAGRQEQLVAMFSGEWWTAHRTPAAVKRMLEGTDVVVGLVDPRSNELIGFARAVTDRTFVAFVLDVIVDHRYREKGLGRRLMDELLRNPELAHVESIELVCQPELIPFYRRWGFTEAVGRSLLMRRTKNPALLGAEGSGTDAGS